MFGENRNMENSGSNAKPCRVTDCEGKNNSLLRYGVLGATALFVLVGTICFFQGFSAGSQNARKLSEGVGFSGGSRGGGGFDFDDADDIPVQHWHDDGDELGDELAYEETSPRQSPNGRSQR